MSGSGNATTAPARGDAAKPPRFHNATLSQQVYEYLREQILANAYTPNTPLPEEALAQSFNVSRVPVREALRRLAADGLVTLIPRQGAVVKELSPREFLDAYRVREALEALAIRLALPNLTAADLEELDRLQGAMTECAERGDADGFFSENAKFHALFIDRSENELLRQLYSPLIDQMRRYSIPSLDLRGGMGRSLEEHRAILEAVRSNDSAAAARLLSEHIQVPQRILEEAPGS